MPDQVQYVQYGAGHTLPTSHALQKEKEEAVKTLSEVGHILDWKVIVLL